MQGSNSYKIDLHQQQELQSELKRAGFRFSKSDYAFWRAANGIYTLTLYRSGKLLIQGKVPERVAYSLKGKGFMLSVSNPIAPEKQGASKWIGTDESGKGDYFGPLVIAATLVTPDTRRELVTIGVKDSKRLSDLTIRKLALEIKALCPHHIVVINPAKYNKTYESMRYYGKLHRILAWGHAQAIENILAKESCEHVISDQFAPERFIRRALSVRGINVTFEQRPRAEDDIAVAAASILARDAYMKSLESLSAEYLIGLTPGASQKVIETGREFVLRHGPEKLKEVAKFHFGTTQFVLNPEMARETQSIDFTPDYFLSIGD